MRSKRIFAGAYDVMLSQVPVTIAYFINPYPPEYYKIISMGMFLFHTSVAIHVTKKYTMGERIFKICCESTNKKPISKILYRNLMMGFMLYAPFVAADGFLDPLLIIISLLVLYPSRSKDNKEMIQSAVDILFKTYYKTCAEEKCNKKIVDAG